MSEEREPPGIHRAIRSLDWSPAGTAEFHASMAWIAARLDAAPEPREPTQRPRPTRTASPDMFDPGPGQETPR